MKRELTTIEKLVAEKADLSKLERQLDMYLVHIRLGHPPKQEADRPAPTRRMFWRHHDVRPGEELEEIPGAIVREFYVFIQTRLGQTRDRIYDINQLLSNNDIKEN